MPSESRLIASDASSSPLPRVRSSRETGAELRCGSPVHHVDAEPEERGESNVAREVADQPAGEQTETRAEGVHRDLGACEGNADADLPAGRNAANADADAHRENVECERKRDDENFEEGCAHEWRCNAMLGEASCMMRPSPGPIFLFAAVGPARRRAGAGRRGRHRDAAKRGRADVRSGRRRRAARFADRFGRRDARRDAARRAGRLLPLARRRPRVARRCDLRAGACRSRFRRSPRG